MKYIRILMMLVVSCWLAGNALAQKVSRVGTTAAPFLKIGVGARALAMGEAGVTQATDVTSLFWNPAGLGKMTKNQFIFNHYDYIAELSFDFAGMAVLLPTVGTFGLYFTHLGAPDVERTTLLEQDGTGEMVSSGFYAVGASFGRALTDRFSIGGSIKYIRERLWHSAATGMAMDIGIMYTTFFKNINIGMSISNFGTGMRMDGRDLLVQHDIDPTVAGNNASINATLNTDEFPLPILFRVGISNNLAREVFGLDQHDLIVAVDAVHPNDNKEYMNVGAEYSFHHLFALRTGYRQLFLEKTEGGFTFGFGMHVNVSQFDVSLDYAAIDYGRFDYVNKFSIMLSF